MKFLKNYTNAESFTALATTSMRLSLLVARRLAGKASAAPLRSNAQKPKAANNPENWSETLHGAYQKSLSVILGIQPIPHLTDTGSVVMRLRTALPTGYRWRSLSESPVNVWTYDPYHKLDPLGRTNKLAEIKASAFSRVFQRTVVDLRVIQPIHNLSMKPRVDRAEEKAQVMLEYLEEFKKKYPDSWRQRGEEFLAQYLYDSDERTSDVKHVIRTGYDRESGVFFLLNGHITLAAICLNVARGEFPIHWLRQIPTETAMLWYPNEIKALTAGVKLTHHDVFSPVIVGRISAAEALSALELLPPSLPKFYPEWHIQNPGNYPNQPQKPGVFAGLANNVFDYYVFGTAESSMIRLREENWIRADEDSFDQLCLEILIRHKESAQNYPRLQSRINPCHPIYEDVWTKLKTNPFELATFLPRLYEVEPQRVCQFVHDLFKNPETLTDDVREILDVWLKDIRSPFILNEIEELLLHKNPQIRRTSLSFIGIIPRRRRFALLKAALKTEKDIQVYQSIKMIISLLAEGIYWQAVDENYGKVYDIDEICYPQLPGVEITIEDPSFWQELIDYFKSEKWGTREISLLEKLLETYLKNNTLAAK